MKKKVKVPEIPSSGLCPLQCFEAGDLLEYKDEEGKYVLKPEWEKELLEEGYCYIPALFVAQGSIPSHNHFVDCAAIDTRKEYIHCQWFLKWFWYTVAKHIAMKKK